MTMEQFLLAEKSCSPYEAITDGVGLGACGQPWRHLRNSAENYGTPDAVAAEDRVESCTGIDSIPALKLWIFDVNIEVKYRVSKK